MKYTTVSSLCEGIAESIRRKEGSTEKINPQDFAQRIDNLQVGGGTSESNIEYLDMSGHLMLLDILSTGVVSTKVSVENAPIPIEGYVCSGFYAVAMNTELQMAGATISLIAVAFDRDAIVSMKQNGVATTQTAYEVLASRGESYVEEYNNLPRITKEQFYTLE